MPRKFIIELDVYKGEGFWKFAEFFYPQFFVGKRNLLCNCKNFVLQKICTLYTIFLYRCRLHTDVHVF